MPRSALRNFVFECLGHGGGGMLSLPWASVSVAFLCRRCWAGDVVFVPVLSPEFLGWVVFSFCHRSGQLNVQFRMKLALEAQSEIFSLYPLHFTSR